MTPNSRSYLNRFIQPDSIVPNPANPQSWNRYAYVDNTPINRIDPNGHDGIPWNEVALFVAIKVIKVVAGGEVTSRDWTEAADRFLPASAAGSQATGQFTAGFLNASKVYELNVVTHKSGETQVYVSGSNKQFVSPQVGASLSGGKIYGETFDEIGTRAFGGYSTQVFGSASLGNWGVSGDGWMGVDSPNLKDINPRKDVREGVYGWDVGVSYGLGTTLSGGIAVLEAEPLSEKARRLFGRKFGDFVEEITHIEKEEVKGPWLLACRAMRGCGR